MEEINEVNDLKAIIATPHGKRFMARHLSEAGLLSKTFEGNSRGFYKQGRQSIAQDLSRDIYAASKKDAEDIHKLIMERAYDDN